MTLRLVLSFALLCIAMTGASPAQDVRGLEVCTAEKQIERRTGCLQANTQFLQQELTRLRRDSDAKLAATGRDLAAAKADIAALKSALAKLESELAALKKSAPAKK